MRDWLHAGGHCVLATSFGMVALAAAPAYGQDPVAQHRELGDGVDRPIHDLSGSGDASSIDIKMAGRAKYQADAVVANVRALIAGRAAETEYVPLPPVMLIPFMVIR